MFDFRKKIGETWRKLAHDWDKWEEFEQKCAQTAGGSNFRKELDKIFCEKLFGKRKEIARG